MLEDDLSLLPFLGSALKRHLEQFPSVESGLSRSERQILEVLVAGECSLSELFHRSHHEKEEAVFLGDTVFLRYLSSLRDVSEPLLATHGGDWNSIAAITETGRQILAGRADHVRLNRIDRWLGGAHLRGDEAVWRWDAENGRLREMV